MHIGMDGLVWELAMQHFICVHVYTYTYVYNLYVTILSYL